MSKIAEPEVVFCEYNHIYDKSLSAECPYCKQIAERMNQFQTQIDATSRKGGKKRGFGRQSWDSDDDATTLLSRGWAALTGRAPAVRKQEDEETTVLRRNDDDDATVLRRDDDDDATVLRRDDDDDAAVLRRGDDSVIQAQNNGDVLRLSLGPTDQGDSHLRNSRLIIRTGSDIATEVIPPVGDISSVPEESVPVAEEVPAVVAKSIPVEEESSAAVEKVIPTEEEVSAVVEEVISVEEESPAVVEEIVPVAAEETASEPKPVKVRGKVIGWLVCTSSGCDYGCSVELQEGDNYICFDPVGHMEVVHDHTGEASADAVIYRDQVTGIFRIRPIQTSVRVNDRTPLDSTYLEPYSSIVFSYADAVFFPAVGVCGFEWRQ